MNKMGGFFDLTRAVIKNIPGKSVGQKIILIECDDWGSNRMPSLKVYDAMKNAGIISGESRYDKFDTLENSDDIQALFQVLKNNHDRNGSYAVMTPFCNMVNPNFERIEASDFTEYYYEIFSETYKRFNRSPDIMDVWHQGIKEGIFLPEYHGREHISVDLWLKALQSGNKKAITAFKHNFVFLSLSESPKIANGFRPNFFIENISSLPALRESLLDGANLFKKTFGFSPTVFNAPNGVFVAHLNQALADAGLHFNAVPRKRLEMNQDGVFKEKVYKTGEESIEGIKYYVRNCNFEPSSSSYSGIGHTLQQIQGAFFTGKAAIISTHRVNFVGGLNKKNRTHGLGELDLLLKSIVSQWPDVVFMSSKDFARVLFA